METDGGGVVREDLPLRIKGEGVVRVRMAVGRSWEWTTWAESEGRGGPVREGKEDVDRLSFGRLWNDRPPLDEISCTRTEISTVHPIQKISSGTVTRVSRSRVPIGGFLPRAVVPRI